MPTSTLVLTIAPDHDRQDHAVGVVTRRGRHAKPAAGDPGRPGLAGLGLSWPTCRRSPGSISRRSNPRACGPRLGVTANQRLPTQLTANRSGSGRDIPFNVSGTCRIRKPAQNPVVSAARPKAEPLSKVQSADQRMRLGMRCRLAPTADVPSHTSGAAMCHRPGVLRLTLALSGTVCSVIRRTRVRLVVEPQQVIPGRPSC